MQYSSKTNSISTKEAGFTLIEMLIISPIIVLAIGGFIAVMVNMVGSVLVTRDQTTMIYESQDALSRVEDDIRISTKFLTTTGALTSPQGKNDDTTAFTNTTNTLILSSLATTKNPGDSSRELVYYKNRPNDCTTQKIFNTVFVSTIVYYIKGSSLWRRTILPNYNTNATVDADTVCAAPWQQNSCSPGYATGNRCQTNDIELAKNISSLTVSYYSTASSTSTIPATNADVAATVKVTVNGSKTTAGRTVSISQSTRATHLNASLDP